MNPTIINECISKMSFDLTPRLTREPGKEMADSDILYIIKALGEKVCPGFQIDESNRDTLLAFARWTLGIHFKAMNPQTKQMVEGRLDRGIFITGPTGTGKTMAVKVMYYLAKMFGETINIGKAQYPLGWRDARAEDLCDEYSRTGELASTKGIASLCIHDLGAEPQETLYMGNRVSVMRQVIERWGERHDRILVITSNLPLCYRPTNDLEAARPTILKRYGARAESRLVEMCNYLYLGGEDRRITSI